jgi:hypothetical protein
VSELGQRKWTSSPRRVLLREKLEERERTMPGVQDTLLSVMYWEAMRVLDDDSNPKRYVIAAHLLRELQDVLSKQDGVVREDGALTKLFGWLNDEWTKLVTGGRAWVGAIDEPLRTFLMRLGAVVAEAVEINPGRREMHRQALTRFDPALAAVTKDIQESVVRSWMKVNDTFNHVAHHRRVSTEEFLRAVDRFEQLLGERLNPPTFEQQDAILALVMEAEGRA